MRSLFHIATLCFVFALPVKKGVAERPAIQYEKSFAARWFTEDRYRVVLDAYRNVEECHPYYEAWSAATPFFQEIGETAQPDFDAYVALPVADNPVAVLWSRFALELNGASDGFPVDLTFRDLVLFSPLLFMDLQENADKKIAARLFLDAAARLRVGDFLQGHPDPRECLDSYWGFWANVQMLLQFLAQQDPEYTYSYLKQLLSLDFGMSAWLWDDDFVGGVQAMCMNGHTSNDLVREVRYIDPKTQEQVVRTFHHSPKGIEATARGFLLNLPDYFGKSLPRYGELTEDMAVPYLNLLEDMLLALQFYLEHEPEHNCRPSVSQIYNDILVSIDELPIKVSGEHATKWEFLENQVELSQHQWERFFVSFGDDFRKQVQSILIEDPLNIFMLQYALSDPILAKNDNMWTQWLTAVTKQHKKLRYHKAIAFRLRSISAIQSAIRLQQIDFLHHKRKGAGKKKEKGSYKEKGSPIRGSGKGVGPIN